MWQHRSLVATAMLALAVIVADPAAAASATVVFNGSRSAPRVALTFDDGWSQGNCRRIAQTLRGRGVKATFFINSIHVTADPAAWRDILAGFEVANHTRSHPDLTKSSSSVIRKQIRRSEHEVEAALGRPMLKVLRPPYGAYDQRVLHIAGDLGYRYVLLWDTESADTSPSATVSRVIANASRGHNGSVVLMHCGPSVTPPAVGAVIDHYRAAGYHLVTVGQLLGMRS
jgi:peptidoglycan-N-acetylglucosamine deacetylase